ncbi:MAG: Phosphomannomutase/phosphoglucomutase [Candidatus Ordinivivax streblomastigis]|uniref:Phosphomannomutase/phosphoglucomutase n=1 Tax=Candidatus Ordinivivax streblomastigis TaxID=2540710 RepID=A0A5M8NZL8_9BACT|nr:MAG: Phosphomannomutase/phosphoglucomutase [Candidatus Ordinivivax streblomastigis]
MSLIKSISGIRGTIGGKTGEGLSPVDVVKFTAAYATLIKSKNPSSKTIVVGRDARISGEMVRNLVVGSLMGMGLDVVDIGLATTPTTELAVTMEHAAGGIILTASHNPKQWNALKLLNEKGEFLNASEGNEILTIAENESFSFVEVDALGKVKTDLSYTKKHIDHVLALKLVDVEAIRKADFTVAIDTVNSVGGLVLPELLKALGVQRVIELNTEPTGVFAHNPEPLPQHLTEIAEVVKMKKADVGFVVDPDVDRLAIITENGDMFGEEYTLVAVADYILSHTPGNTVSNMSSTRALRDVTEKYGQTYTASAVGEVNVVEQMKASHAVIGGEGNGGVIYPESHYGRDALVGIGLFLTHLAKSKKTISALRATYPSYFMAKHRIDLTPTTDVDALLESIKKKYSSYPVNDIDGVKVDFPDKWVHFRKSNTEPIIRIYTEAPTQDEAEELALSIRNSILETVTI